MYHSFDTKIAEKYGIAAAVLLNHFYFWIEKNKANNVHFHEGVYWTYSTREGLSKLFPYLSPRQIDYAVKKLIDDNVVVTGNYNKSSYDHTLWYAITKKGYSILQNCEIGYTELLNRNDEIVKPIPDIITDKETDIRSNIYISDGFQNFLDMVKEVCPTIYQRYQNKVDSGNLEAAREVKRLLDNILGRTEEFWLESDFEELKEVFARASQTYIVKPKYAGLDIAWVLNNIEKVKNTPIEQHTSAAPKAEKFDAMACLQELYEKHKAEEGKE